MGLAARPGRGTFSPFGGASLAASRDIVNEFRAFLTMQQMAYLDLQTTSL
jgi:hypothetical protein